MLRPIYKKYDHEQERWIFGLSEDDFYKVMHGYACGNCLEDYQGKWLAACPVCGKPAEDAVDLPSEWRHSGVS